MAIGEAGEAGNLIRHLRRAALLPDGGDISDARLLNSFINDRDEAAFEVLVRRHGAMVLGVCQRILCHAQDAEDAFQATFLVLVRKAAAIIPRHLVGHWLYGVAYRTAMKAKIMKHKRRLKESQVTRESREPGSQDWEEVQPILDRELNQLPEKYRLPIFLCDLQGQKHREAARELGWPAGTLETRLAMGRRLLATRLARHGITLSSAGLALLLSSKGAAAAVPAPLLAAALKACALFKAGNAAISTQVLALAEGVLHAMLLSKIRVVAALCLTLGIVCAGSSLSFSSGPQRPAAPPRAVAPAKPHFPPRVEANRRHLENIEWYVRSVDRTRRTLTLEAKRMNTWGSGMVYVETPSGTAGPSGLYLNNLSVTKQARITLNDKPAQLKDLAQGMRVSVHFAPDSFALDVVSAVPAPLPPRFVLREVDAEQRTITVGLDLGLATFEKLRVADNADIELHTSRGMRKVALKDLETKMTVHLELAPDERGTALSVRVIKAAK